MSLNFLVLLTSLKFCLLWLVSYKVNCVLPAVVWNSLVGYLVGAGRDEFGLAHLHGVARFDASVIEEVEWKRDDTVNVDDELDDTEDDVGSTHRANFTAWRVERVSED